MLVTPNLKGYWRFEGNANDASGNGNNGTVVGATNWINQVPMMTSNTAPKGVASAKTTYSDTYPAWKAFNRTNVDLEDCWFSAQTSYPEWIQYEFETSHKITKYAITSRNNSNNPSTPRSWVLYGSNTGNFTGEEDTLDTRTDGFPSDTHNERREFDVSSPDDYKYYRLHITAGWRTDYVGVGNLELLNEQGKFGRCYSFDGTDDYIDVGKMGTFGSTNLAEFTFCGWVKSAKTNAPMTLTGTVADGSTTFFRITLNCDSTGAGVGAGYVFFGMREEDGKYLHGAVESDTGITDNNWHFLEAYVKSSTNTIIIKVDTVSQTTTYHHQQTPVNFANFQYNNVLGAINIRGTIDLFYEGLLDEPMFFAGQLSDSDSRRVMLGLHPIGG